jgi:hypothetical protein
VSSGCFELLRRRELVHALARVAASRRDEPAATP